MKRGRFRLGIYDRDAWYARRLGSYIQRSCRGQLEIMVFTRLETLGACLACRGADLLLAGMDARGICGDSPAVQTVFLTETAEEEQLPGILKTARYQSAEQIWKDLLELAGERIGQGALFPEKRSGTAFIGICAVPHVHGDTVLGLVMSRILAETSKKRTLFVTLEEFSPLDVLAGQERDGAGPELSELYYYYSQEELTGARLQSAVCRWGEAEYILPVRMPEDLYRDGDAYEAEFFRRLAELGSYDRVIMDMGNSIWGREGALRLYGTVFAPADAGPAGEVCVTRFRQWMREKGMEDCVVPVLMDPDLRKTAGQRSGAEQACRGRMGRLAEELLERSGYGAGRNQEETARAAGA